MWPLKCQTSTPGKRILGVVVGATEAVVLLDQQQCDYPVVLCACRFPSAQAAWTFLRFQLFFTVIWWLKQSALLCDLKNNQISIHFWKVVIIRLTLLLGAGCHGESVFYLTCCLLLLCQYSELELAINALVTEFHKAADDGPTMNTTQFQTMMSKQLPVVAKVPEAPPPDQ